MPMRGRACASLWVRRGVPTRCPRNTDAHNQAPMAPIASSSRDSRRRRECSRAAPTSATSARSTCFSRSWSTFMASTLLLLTVYGAMLGGLLGNSPRSDAHIPPHNRRTYCEEG